MWEKNDRSERERNYLINPSERERRERNDKTEKRDRDRERERDYSFFYKKLLF